MDRFTYEQLRVNRPELSLPPWWFLRPTDRHIAKKLSIDKLIEQRNKKLMMRVLLDNGAVDRIAPKRLAIFGDLGWRGRRYTYINTPKPYATKIT
jgi:hypothetical protein